MQVLGVRLTGRLLREQQTPATAGMTDELQTLNFLHPGAEMPTSHLHPIWKHHLVSPPWGPAGMGSPRRLFKEN